MSPSDILDAEALYRAVPDPICAAYPAPDAFSAPDVLARNAAGRCAFHVAPRGGN
jgi:hypothetical protein